MAYVNCPKCNQKALSVATRCPRCGEAFEAGFFAPPPPAPRQVPRIVLLAAGAIGVLAVLNLVPWKARLGPATASEGMTPPPAAAPRRPPVAAPAPERREPVVLATRETVPPVVRETAPPPVVDSKPAPAPAPAAVAVPPARAALAVARPEPAATDAESRYASTWVNVRSGRSPTAPVTRVLNPGESVAVDQPDQGWLRVRRAGEVVGYVDARFLDSTPR